MEKIFEMEVNPNDTLKELERIKNRLFEYFKSAEVRPDDIENYEKLIFKPVKQALLELKAIKEANYNDAIGKVAILASELGTSKDMKFTETRFPRMLIIIQQALLKAEEQKGMENFFRAEYEKLRNIKNEQEKVQKVIFEKNVDIRNLKHYIEIYSDDIALKVYNGFHNKDEELTQEEFNSLKEMVKQYEKR